MKNSLEKFIKLSLAMVKNKKQKPNSLSEFGNKIPSKQKWITKITEE
jgi:hypothetical protein